MKKINTGFFCILKRNRLPNLQAAGGSSSKQDCLLPRPPTACLFFRKANYLWCIILIAFVGYLSSCREKTYIPKPKGYFNIEIPAQEYVMFDSACEYTFEVSKQAAVVQSPDAKTKGNCWYNIVYPRFDATIFLTYDPVQNNLKKYLEDSHELVYKHVVKSTGIEEMLIADTVEAVYGIKYKIDGDAACPYQFYLTDNSQHFFRAALYFNFRPNYDSLSQVVSFIEADMDHMIETFRWKHVDLVQGWVIRTMVDDQLVVHNNKH